MVRDPALTRCAAGLPQVRLSLHHLSDTQMHTHSLRLTRTHAHAHSRPQTPGPGWVASYTPVPSCGVGRGAAGAWPSPKPTLGPGLPLGAAVDVGTEVTGGRGEAGPAGEASPGPSKLEPLREPAGERGVTSCAMGRCQPGHLPFPVRGPIRSSHSAAQASKACPLCLAHSQADKSIFKLISLT